jgi:excisionase family DNA binding protein
MNTGVGERRAYSVTETATLLGVHPNTVRNYVTAGLLVVCRPVEGGRVLIPAGSIDALLAGRGEDDA